MRYILDEQQCRNLAVSMHREWLLTNGLGGYAMGTPCGANTRRYHGLLVAATDPPATRYVLLAGMDAFVQAGHSNPVGLSTNQYPGAIYPEGYLYLRHFHVDREAVWIFRTPDADVEQSLRVHEGENACTIEYANIGDRALTLTLRPFVSHKSYHSNFYEMPGYPHSLSFPKDQTIVEHDGISLWLTHPNAERAVVQGWYYRFEHEEELNRGLDPRDDLYCPCELSYDLEPGTSAIIVAATSDVKDPAERPQPEGRTIRLTDMLQEAAAKFVVKTEHRTSIIAGYPWFTDWGRDTMISVPGILVHTGRLAEARDLLMDYAASMNQGLIPNRFTETGGADYNTADASLWFVNAVYKTLESEWSREFAEKIYPKLIDLIAAHQTGTLFGIHVDPADGLLSQGQEGVQLTWMDAKIGDWVVTPRHGKPVEINGLWINALRVLEWLSGKLEKDSEAFARAAKQAEESFEQKFWHDGRLHYLDTVDPMDATLRPNQVIAMALPFGPAKGEHALRALKTVEQLLYTPYGLRSLGADEPGYRGQYKGALPELDAAYHQGTVWPWLLGPYCTAIVKLRGDKAEVKRILKTARVMLAESGMGGLSEVYDGDEPQTPGGCPWQAWSVAEVLRSWVEDAGGD